MRQIAAGVKWYIIGMTALFLIAMGARRCGSEEVACFVGQWTYRPRVKRSSEAVIHFKRDTGYPHGRPGWVVDHIVPLCAGGDDAPTNMQWQSRASAKRKDTVEKALCRCLRLQSHLPPSSITGDAPDVALATVPPLSLVAARK